MAEDAHSRENIRKRALEEINTVSNTLNRLVSSLSTIKTEPDNFDLHLDEVNVKPETARRDLTTGG